MKQLKTIVSLSCLLLFAACGSTEKPFVALSESLQEHIDTTDIYLLDGPDQMNFDIEKSNLTAQAGGGLLFAMIDVMVESNRESKGKKAVSDIQKALKPADVQAKLETKLIPIFKKTKWMNTNEIHHVKTLDKKACEKACQTSSADTIMMSVFSYKMSPDFKTLMADIHLTLYPASEKIKSMIQAKSTLTPIFKTHVSATQTLAHPSKDIQQNGAMWAKDDGRYLKTTMDQLIKRLTKDLKNVLKYPNHSPET